MTLPSATCSNLVVIALLAFQSAAVSNAAEVTGSVELLGAGSNADVSGAVVWLEPLDVHDASVPHRERMIQKSKTFKPHILAISVGSSVEFPNLDPIFHNAFSNFNGQVFDIGLYPPGKSRAVTFRRAGVVRIFCNIHPAMSAVIVVVDTPYYAVSDRLGHLMLPNVPRGRYRENVFFERSTPESLAALSREFEVKDSSEVLPAIHISEIGYLPLPHTDKHGQPYPAESDSPYTVH